MDQGVDDKTTAKPKQRKRSYDSPRLITLGTAAETTTGGSGLNPENPGNPPQSQPNRFP